MKHLLLPVIFITIISGCTQQQVADKTTKLVQPTIFRALKNTEKSAYTAAVMHMYDSLLLKRGFNGGIIVAKNGEILFEEYRGYINLKTKDSINSSTPFHLASVSKTFTGMATMKLAELGKLKLSDSLQVYFPAFPYHGITIKMLLNHRSGLPNYVYAMAKDTAWRKKLATNADMLQFLTTKPPPVYNYPNRSFNYCNTNYALLALIIEKVSGQPYPDYMKDNVFIPLGMKNTFVFSLRDTARYVPSYGHNNSTFGLEPLDCIYGDKNIYSTPKDLLLWDQSLYQNTFVTKATYEDATQPTSHERPGVHNYGAGWRLLLNPDAKVVYHNGWWHGNNTCFTRLVQDTATIIILGNKFNRNIYCGTKFSAIFNNEADDTKQLE